LNAVGLLSLDVETRGLPPLAPPPRVCGEVYLALPYLAQALGSLDARVVACVRKEEGPRWWWAYQVRVETAGLRFLLVRRYSQFRRLHARLRALPTPAKDRLPRRDAAWTLPRRVVWHWCW